MKNQLICMRACFVLALAVLTSGNGRADSGAPDLKHLERSFCVDASLISLPQNGSPTTFSIAAPLTEAQIRNAAHLLTYEYAANRLYLAYQKEISLHEAQRIFQLWRHACPVEVEVVPALVLQKKGTNQADLFTASELRALSGFFRKEINPTRLAVLDPRGQSESLRALNADYGQGLIHLGLGPDEPLAPPFTGGVEDTATALENGKENEDWQQPGLGRETLRKCVQSRNDKSCSLAWSLIVVGGDDAAVSATNPPAQGMQRNVPLAKGRNTLAAEEILHWATPSLLVGFSTDLQRLQVHSGAIGHDGIGYSFYEMLKQGHIYVGHYARPFHEVVKIYQTLRSGKAPEH